MHVRRQVVDEELQRALGRRHPGAARPADEQRHVGLLLQVAGLAHEIEMPERAGLEALAFELDLVLLGGLGIGDQFLDRMDRHHPLRRQARHRLEIFVVGVERDRHHVGAELHQLDLLLDARRRHAVLHDRIDLVGDHVVQLLPVGVMDARHHLAVGLDRFFQRAPAVDVRDRGAGLHRIDVLLRAAGDVLLRRAEVVVRVGGARVAGDGDDQFFHDVPHSTFSICPLLPDRTTASNTAMPCSTWSMATG